ncbi:MAG: hypothetical protein AB7S26_28565 [Sandaracinaceae bacterium]
MSEPGPGSVRLSPLRAPCERPAVTMRFASGALAMAFVVASVLAGCRSQDGYADCTPGFTYRVGCAPPLGVQCNGDPKIHVCSDDVAPGGCSEDSPSVLASDDDSGPDYCPEAEFVCPPSGRVAIRVEAEDRDFCEIGTMMVEGPMPAMDTPCTAGVMYEVGCTSLLGASCTGDPTLSVCVTGTVTCDRAASFEYSDDDDGRCPRAEFLCPPAGRVVIQAAPFSSGASFSCDYALRALGSDAGVPADAGLSADGGA